MTIRVHLVDLAVQTNVVPLTMGYLVTYARRDPEIAAAYSFSVAAPHLGAARDVLLKQMLDADADIYAFSCYVWNMGNVRYLVGELLRRRPGTTIVLGGPQVIGHADIYLDKNANDRVFVVNGEGEATFANLLRTLRSGGELDQVLGLSFVRDGAIVTTPPQPLIAVLDDIPSPFLEGVFTENYMMTVFETNRGCPYQCSFCYWGRGDDLSVRKFSEGRIRQELEWMARHNIFMMLIADANWGLLPRDVELSRLIVECKREYGFPAIVNFSAAKDKVKRSAAIAEMFADAGIITSQAIGIQSMSEPVLKTVKRKNIKLELLQEVRVELEEKGVSTFTELIWALPSETLESFGKSLDTLCGASVSTIVVYPGLLLHSTPMEKRAEELGIRTAPSLNEAEELKLIVATNEVSEEEYEEGMWMVFGLYALYNCLGLKLLGSYLQREGITSWSQLARSFALHCRSRKVRVAGYWRSILAERRQSEFAVLGRLVHDVLHAERDDFLDQLVSFVSSQPWWDDDGARFRFELDLVGLPHIYANTPIRWHDADGRPRFELEYIRFLGESGSVARVEVAQTKLELLRELLGADHLVGTAYAVEYMANQFPWMPSKTTEQNAAYCHGMIQRSASIRPRWRPLVPAAS